MEDALAPIFGTSAVRREILAWFFARPGAIAHPRELARRLGRPPQVVGRELARLESAGILASETVGRSRRYRVDLESSIVSDVRSLFAKTIGKPTAVTRTMIDDHRAEIEALCRAYGVRRLDVFGSAVRDDFDPERSDVDFLVEFEAGRTPSLRGYLELRDALAAVVGHPADLVMSRAVRNPYIKAAIESERQLVYATLSADRLNQQSKQDGQPVRRGSPRLKPEVSTVRTTLINEHRDEIAALCRRYRVRRLDAFGSAVRDDFDPDRSDVDFVFEFDDAPERNRFHDFMDLKEDLTRLLGRPVDLVSSTAIRNKYFKAAVEASRESIYGP